MGDSRDVVFWYVKIKIRRGMARRREGGQTPRELMASEGAIFGANHRGTARFYGQFTGCLTTLSEQPADCVKKMDVDVFSRGLFSRETWPPVK